MRATNSSQDALKRPADVAIVGSGPVGMKLALDLADAGFDVLLIESGDGEGDVAALSDAEIVGTTHAPMRLSYRRGLGGTSRLWGGRAVPFDPVDFSRVDPAGARRWPISAGEVEPWYQTACEFLDCGPPDFHEPWPGRSDITHGLRLTALERWCAQPDMQRVHGARLLSHPNIRVALGATVLKLAFDDLGNVSGLVAAVGAEAVTVKAKTYVVAAGGVETARLLLASRLEQPSLFGGPDGALGRFYMGHIFGSIADIQFIQPDADRLFEFHKDASGRYVRRRLVLDGPVQDRLGLMNVSMWPELPELYDPRHRSAILSLAYLAIAAPGIGPRLLAPAIRERKLGSEPQSLHAHLWNVLSDVPAAMAFAVQFLSARYLNPVRLPGFFFANQAHRYAFHFHAEHGPDAASSVTLSDAQDALGMRRAKIALRFGDETVDSILATHDAVEQRLAKSELARLHHKFEPGDRARVIHDLASDGFHQIGTARMSASPKDGVVDANARAHGVQNLYLAGSSVFPTSGQANPTLLAVALAARLASHLKSQLTVST